MVPGLPRRAYGAAASRCARHSRARDALAEFLDGRAARFRSPEYWDYAANKGRTNNPNLIWYP